MGWSKARGILDNGVWYSHRGTVDRPRYVPLYTIPQCISDQRLEINDFEMPWTLEGVEYTLCVNSETGHTYVEGKVFTELLAGFCQRQFVKPWSFEKLFIQIPYNVIVEPNQYLAQINAYGHPTYFFV
ncbi:hypothetical protein SPFM8_00040 [Salmonella phage SPFM8]|nr:hypothetical protein SPFM8_00040 [Salmonella phage SPFM8]